MSLSMRLRARWQAITPWPPLACRWANCRKPWSKSYRVTRRCRSHAWGRLAVDLTYRGQKLGAALLWDAVTRSLRSEVAVAALVVDAKDEAAEAFYRHFGFVSLEGEGRRLVLPLARLKA